MAGWRAIALAVTVLTVLAAVMAGCGAKNSAPTAERAGRQLQTQITALMTKIAATNVKITAPGTSGTRCGKGRAQRTYAVSASVTAAGATPDGLVDQMLSAVNADADYAIVDPMVAGSYQVSLRDVQSRTNLTLASPGDGVVTATGRTDCLKAS